MTKKPRVIGTLAKETYAGVRDLKREGLRDSRIVAEGVVARRMLDDAALAQVRTWTTLLESGAAAWQELVDFCALGDRDREKAARKMLERLVEHELGAPGERPAKRAPGRGAA